MVIFKVSSVFLRHEQDEKVRDISELGEYWRFDESFVVVNVGCLRQKIQRTWDHGSATGVGIMIASAA